MRHEAVIKLYPNVHNQVNNKAFDVNGNEINLDEEKIFEEIVKLKAEYDTNRALGELPQLVPKNPLLACAK